MRRRQQVLEGSERVLSRQGLGIENSTAAPAMARARKVSMSACSSTIGPRDVLTSRAVGFMSASSAAPTRPRVRSLRMRWMVTISARRKSSSFVTISAPAAAAVFAVKFWLQAMIYMPNARPMLATWAPTFPRPTTPRTLPSTSLPIEVCQPPARIELLSPTR
jgi:hypothetical protein